MIGRDRPDYKQRAEVCNLIYSIVIWEGYIGKNDRGHQQEWTRQSTAIA